MHNQDKETMGVILLAGGLGSRFSPTTLKQFVPFQGKPLALHSFDIFFHSPLISEIVVVCKKEHESFFPKDTRVRFAAPGTLRHLSVFSGFAQISPEVSWICVHDSVRPLITHNMLELLFKEGKIHGAATLASPLIYTTKKFSPQNLVIETVDRSSLCVTHTPQLLHRQIFELGMEKTLKENLVITDDVCLAEILHHPVKLVFTEEPNLKVTYPSDLQLVQALVNV